MKRCVLVLMVICVLFSTLPVSAAAAETGSGTCGEAVWHMESDGTLYITGLGRMLYHGGWENDSIRKIVIEEGVTTICMDAFRDAVNLTSVKIAGTVRSIGFHSFDGCTSLKQVWLPDSVNVVGEYAFHNCTSLTDVRMGDRIVMIGEYAFAYCPITVLDLPDGLLHLGSFAFTGALMDTVVIPDTITRLSWGTFQDCEKLKNLHIPEGVVSGHLDVFQNCKALETVVIPASMESISIMLDYRDNLRTMVYKGDYIGDPFSDYSNANNGHVYDVWYPADNPTWTQEARDSMDGIITWMPYLVAENGTLVSQVSSTQNIEQRLAQLMETEPSGSGSLGGVMYWNQDFVSDMKDELFPDRSGEVNAPMEFGALRVGDEIRKFYYSDQGNGNYHRSIEDYFLVTGIYEDHITVAHWWDTKTVAGYRFTWEDALTREELERTDANSGEAVYDYCTCYGESTTLVLPEVKEQEVQASKFPAQIRTTSAPKQVQPSNYNDAGGFANPFVDVRQDRFESAILWAYYNGITTGTTATTFSPENTCTRKQIVTFLWRYMGQPIASFNTNPFTDVPQDRFYNAITWAYKGNITTGTTATTFSPEAPCTRKQIVTFLWRAAGAPEPASYVNPFVDVKQDKFEKAILWAYYKGITTGTTDTTFSPEEPCTRKQIVTFLWRFAGQPQYGSQPPLDVGGMVLPQPQNLRNNITLTVGRSVALAQNASLDWSQASITSSVPGILQLGEEGMITAVSPGNTTVTITEGDYSRTYSITVVPPLTDDSTTEMRIAGAGGHVYDGMTGYVGDSVQLTFRVSKAGQTQRLWVHNSNWNPVDVVQEEEYDDRTYLTLHFERPGDTTITILTEDETAGMTLNIHVEEFHPFDPGHRDLLSPEEFACYASLASGSCGFRVDDSIGGWREGAPLHASELTYEKAVAWGVGSDHYWETSQYYEIGAIPGKIYNYVGDQEWEGELCYRIQDGF